MINYRTLPPIEEVDDDIISIVYDIQSLYGRIDGMYTVNISAGEEYKVAKTVRDKPGKPSVPLEELMEVPWVDRSVISELKPEMIDVAREIQSLMRDYMGSQYNVYMVKNKYRFKTKAVVYDFKTKEGGRDYQKHVKGLKKRIFSRKFNKGCVYILKSDGHYKIGFSARLDTRLKQHMTSMPRGVLVAVSEQGDSKTLEAMLHKQLREYRTSGEWFNLTLNALDEVMRNFDFVKIGVSMQEYLYGRTN